MPPRLRNSGLEYTKKAFPMHKHCWIKTDEESNDLPNDVLEKSPTKCSYLNLKITARTTELTLMWEF